MLLKAFSIAALVFFSSFNNEHINHVNPVNDWSKMQLKGRVKSISKEQCRVMKKSGEKNCKIKELIVFNSGGYIVEEQTWEFAQLVDRQKYVYNNNILTRIERLDANNAITTTYMLYYDQDGNRIEEKIFDKDNQLESRYTHQYDKNGREIQMDRYNMHMGGNHDMKETFAYDNFGNLINHTQEHESGDTHIKISYKYDQYKKITEKTTNTVYENSGKYLTTIRYTFDSQGNVVQEDQIQNKRKSKTTITMDTTGNWLKRTTTESRDTYLTTERVIEYF
ncbi:MAG TPA: hypothetical protein VIN08_09320 [Ohtaekwangia sp.]|uniref:hypothetical protein n=1 Tax=Ohtaekwangia sp. TaxID=2066019 RepID=UPI002F93656C